MVFRRCGRPTHECNYYLDNTRKGYFCLDLGVEGVMATVSEDLKGREWEWEVVKTLTRS